METNMLLERSHPKKSKEHFEKDIVDGEYRNITDKEICPKIENIE